MLVIISDLHLSDGTSGETVRDGAFSIFRDRLGDLAYAASWRRDGTYKPIEDCHLVLLGDILDVIRSTRWLESSVRPWSDPNSPAFIETVRSITARILENNDRSLAILKNLSESLTIPGATAQGGPAEAHANPEGGRRRLVKVHTHYLVGNHDWFFHLPGEPYNQIRQSIIDAIGLENPAAEPFPHDPGESSAIQQIYRDHQVFARHGDIFDPFNYDGDRNKSSLGDAIVVDLIDKFAATVRSQLGSVLPKRCIDGLNEIDNLRPMSVIPVWVDSLLKRTCPDTALQMQVKKLWDDLVDQLLGLKFVQGHHSFLHLFDHVEQLEWGLKLSTGILTGNLTRLLAWIAEKFRTDSGSLYRHAAVENAFKTGAARVIVYGHTHKYEMVPLTSSMVGSSFFDQVYLNSGTWRPYHELSRVHPEQEEFVKFQLMTYLAFFKGDERGGRPYEVWSGVLAARPN